MNGVIQTFILQILASTVLICCVCFVFAWLLWLIGLFDVEKE